MPNPAAEASDHYRSFIESCYSRSPGLDGYYRPLVEYISSRFGGSDCLTKGLTAFSVVGDDADLTEVGKVDINADVRTSKIFVLEGKPCPEAIAFLGCKYLVRPELFIRHLNFSVDEQRHPKYYNEPTVPSARHSTIHIRMVTLARSSPSSKKIINLVRARQEAEDSCRLHNENISHDQNFGSTRYRAVHLLNHRTFTVEQLISFTFVKRHSDWTGICLLDKGLDNGERLKYERDLPWEHFVGYHENPDSIPIIPNPPNISAAASSTLQRTVSAWKSPALCQYHPTLDLPLDTIDEKTLFEEDPFYTVGHILHHAALCWSLVINCVQNDIEACRGAEYDDASASLEQLRFNVNFIDYIQASLYENLDVLRCHEYSDWPKCKSPERQKEMQDFQAKLVRDYEYLLSRCETLLMRGEKASAASLRAMRQTESSRGIKQADKVNSLTTLAYLYLPVNLAAAIFGMNISQFSQQPSVWTFVLTTILLLMAGLGAAWHNEVFCWCKDTFLSSRQKVAAKLRSWK